MAKKLIPTLEQMPRRTKILEQAQAIALLHNPKYRTLLRFFMPQPNTISATATATGQSVKRTYNYVEKLLEAELLEVSSNSGASIILRHTSSQTVSSRRFAWAKVRW